MHIRICAIRHTSPLCLFLAFLSLHNIHYEISDGEEIAASPFYLDPVLWPANFAIKNCKSKFAIFFPSPSSLYNPFLFIWCSWECKYKLYYFWTFQVTLGDFSLEKWNKNLLYCKKAHKYRFSIYSETGQLFCAQYSTWSQFQLLWCCVFLAYPIVGT